MTDLQIRTIIVDSLARAENQSFVAKKSGDRIAIMYFNGCIDALWHLLQEIDTAIDKELEEMVKQENGK